MSINDDLIIKSAIKYLTDKQIPLSKVMIQKLMLYLRATGLPLSYKFEPYLYGPYSKELSSNLDELLNNNQLSYDTVKKTYSLGDNFLTDSTFNTQVEKKVGKSINDFLYIINHDTNFGNIEIFGTVLYCYLALKKIGIEKDKDKVLQEFASWKGSKYPPEKASPIYDRLISKLVVA